MRIIIVNDYASVTGGASQVAIANAIALAKTKENDVYFFAGMGPIDDQLSKAGVKVTCLGQPDLLTNPSKIRAMLTGLYNFSVAKSFRSFLQQLEQKQSQETIIHIHSFTKSLSQSVIKTAFASAWPVIFTLHDYFLACPNGAFFLYPQGELCQKKPLSINCIVTNCDARSYTQKLWRILRQAILKIFIRVQTKGQNYIYVSELSRSLIKPYLNKGASYDYLPSLIGQKKSKEVNPAKSKKVLAIGRLSAEKGFHIFDSLAKQSHFDFEWVGDGPLADEIDDTRVQLAGWLSQKEVIKKIRKARCLILPSTVYETQGLVLFEAMANGIPVITSACVGAASLIKENDLGIVCNEPTVENFAAALETLESDKLVRKKGLNGYKFYWHRYIKLASIDSLTKTYQKIQKNIT